MIRIYKVVPLLLMILPVNLQDIRPVGVCRHETRYDRQADITTVQCDNLIRWGEAPAGLTVKANTSFPGKESIRGIELSESTKFWLALSSNRGVATRQTRPLFQEATTLYLSTDSARLEIPVKDYRKTFFELIRSLEESARAEINPEDLQKLLSAKSLEGKWGSIEFKFSAAALASLKGFISHQVFGAPSR